MRNLMVELADRRYPIAIGQHLFDDHALMTRHIASRQVMIVTNEVVAPLYFCLLYTSPSPRDS